MFSAASNILKVSVIIPVFNLENFIERAIRSALAQEEVLECIVVDDGSTDNTSRICRNIAKEQSRVLVLSHPEGVNRGVSNSRNLALKSATGTHVSFLDGDDYFLPNRFVKVNMAFQANPLIDGVYDAMISEPDLNSKSPDLTTIKEDLVPHELFYNMAPFGKSGHFSICGLTVKVETALRNGDFNTGLILTQDTEWVAKLTLDFILVAGDIENPVVVRGLHPLNSSKNLPLLRSQRVAMCLGLLSWANRTHQPEKAKALIIKVLLKYHYEENQLFSDAAKWSKKRADFVLLAQMIKADIGVFRNPRAKYFFKLILGLTKGVHLNFYE